MYWDMTYREISAAIEAFQERQKIDQERLKAEMMMLSLTAYRHADLIGAVVSNIMGGRNKIPSLSEAFPGVFPEEMLQPRQQDWRVMKTRIEQYGAEWKRKRGEKRGDDDRRVASADHRRDGTTPQGIGPSQARA